MRGIVARGVITLAVAALLILLALPILSLLLRVPPGELWTDLQQPFVFEALKLSLMTSAAARRISTGDKGLPW
jgi:ABC-type sulfate transport system permease component